MPGSECLAQFCSSSGASVCLRVCILSAVRGSSRGHHPYPFGHDAWQCAGLEQCSCRIGGFDFESCWVPSAARLPGLHHSSCGVQLCIMDARCQQHSLLLSVACSLSWLINNNWLWLSTIIATQSGSDHQVRVATRMLVVIASITHVHSCTL